MLYVDAKAQFTGLLNRRDITASQVTTFFQQAISRCQRELRVPAMEKAKNITIGTTYNGLTIPGDYLELISLEASDGIELSKTSADIVRQQIASNLTGKPRIYARKGSKLFLAPIPAAGDTVRMDYFAEFAAVSLDTDTNVLLTIAPDLPVYGALSYACDWFEDDRAPAFEARYEAIKGELEDQAEMDELSGSAVVAPTFLFPED